MKRVLIVEDEQDHRLLLRDMLEESGYVCEEAEDGIFAMEKLRATSIDLVLTDLNMPRMNGLQLIERMAGQMRDKAIPIILVSSQVPELRPSFGSKGNVFAMLPKPYQWKSLLLAVAAATKHSQNMISLAR